METKVDIGKLDPNFTVEQKPPKTPNVEVLYVDITHCTPKAQFLVCCAAVFVLYLLYGYLQVSHFDNTGFPRYTLYFKV